MDNSKGIDQLRSNILKGMALSAEKLKSEKKLLGRDLVVSEEGKVTIVPPHLIK